MALRVTVVVAPDLTIIRVDGRLAGRGPGELERECRAARRPVVLDLTQLTGLDHAGCQLLRQLADEGLHVVGASPYIAMLLAAPALAPARSGPATPPAPPYRPSLGPKPSRRRPPRNGGATPPEARAGAGEAQPLGGVMPPQLGHGCRTRVGPGPER